jgi:membrane protease YdiL (CAAX protease family)
MYPWWTVYSTLIMVSIVAGVSEEAGFRGYMQAPLEKRYGAAVAIGVTAVAFWLAHLNHPSGLARGPSLLIMAIALGALAFASRSILPPIVTHAFADSVVFTGAQSEIGPEWLWSPPLLGESGFDVPVVGTIVVATVAGIVAVMAMRRLRRATRC